MQSKSKKSKGRSSKWWEVSKRHDKHCERCKRKIEGGRFCYYCGKKQGLW